MTTHADTPETGSGSGSTIGRAYGGNPVIDIPGQRHEPGERTRLCTQGHRIGDGSSCALLMTRDWGVVDVRWPGSARGGPGVQGPDGPPGQGDPAVRDRM
jgi:hypothetical protein